MPWTGVGTQAGAAAVLSTNWGDRGILFGGYRYETSHSHGTVVFPGVSPFWNGVDSPLGRQAEFWGLPDPLNRERMFRAIFNVDAGFWYGTPAFGPYRDIAGGTTRSGDDPRTVATRERLDAIKASDWYQYLVANVPAFSNVWGNAAASHSTDLDESTAYVNESDAGLLDPAIYGTSPAYCAISSSLVDADGNQLPIEYEVGTQLRISAIEEDNEVDLAHFDLRVTSRQVTQARNSDHLGLFGMVCRIETPLNRSIPVTQKPARLKLTGTPRGESFAIWVRDSGEEGRALGLSSAPHPDNPSQQRLVEQSRLVVHTRYNARMKPNYYVQLPGDIVGWKIDNIRDIGRRKFMELELVR